MPLMLVMQNDDGNDEKGLNTGAKAEIIIGVIALVAFVSVVVFFILILVSFCPKINHTIFKLNS